MAETDDQRGADKGSFGRTPHEHNEGVAKAIVRMVGYGMSQAEISACLNDQYGRGYSPDTLQRHYREALDQGLAMQKEKLLAFEHKVAFLEAMPEAEGVSKDQIFKIASDSRKWLLNVVHRMRPGQVNEFDGSPINVTISQEDSEL